MADLNRLLGQLLGSPAASGFAGGVAGGVASNLLTSKRGRKMSKKALKLGGLVALGGLAYHAWQRYQETQTGGGPGAPALAARPSSTPPALPVREPDGLFAPPELVEGGFMPAPDDERATEATGLILVRTMIAAAKADGKLDGAETQAIFQRVEQLELSPDERSRLFDELRQPWSVEELAAAATTPQLAVEVYLAALMAIETDTPQERAWLAHLATALELEPELVRQLEAMDAAALAEA